MTWNEETYIKKCSESNRICVVCKKVFNLKYRKLPKRTKTCSKECSKINQDNKINEFIKKNTNKYKLNRYKKTRMKINES